MADQRFRVLCWTAASLVILAAGVFAVRLVAGPRPSGGDAPAPRPHLYVTWAPLEPDAFVAAWLIRRFLDPAARFAVVPAGTPVEEVTGTGFDVPGGRWQRTHDRCTSEHVLAEIGPTAPEVAGIVSMVRQLELASWLSPPDSPAGRLRSAFLQIERTAQDPNRCLEKAFGYMDQVRVAGGTVASTESVK